MLRHFLKRDFLDFLVWWIVVGITTITVVLLHLFPLESLATAALPSGYILLLITYFLFANVPMSYVLGSRWRTQHGWSRYYLLALPLSHWKLFGILHARIAVFWLPLILVMSAFGALYGWTLGFNTRQWTLSCLGLFTSAVLMMEMNIWSVLQMERIRGYVSNWSRLRAWVSSIVVSWGFIALLLISWTSLLLPEGVAPRRLGPLSVVASSASFPVSLVVAALWAWWNARRWCVTLGRVRGIDPA